MAKKKTDKDKKVKHARLAWQILGAKFLYYEGQKHGIPTSAIPEDSLYDKWEDEYLKLSEELGLEPTAQMMVGFDSSRPSCKMVMEALISSKGKHKMNLTNFKAGPTKKANPVQEVRKKVNHYQKELADVLEELKVDEKIAKKIRIRMKKRFKV